MADPSRSWAGHLPAVHQREPVRLAAAVAGPAQDEGVHDYLPAVMSAVAVPKENHWQCLVDLDPS